MNLDLVTAVLESANKERIGALLDDKTTVFWVDWREGDDDIVKYCEAVLQTGSLTAEWVSTAPLQESDLFICSSGRRIRVPLIIGCDDRHITLCALNQVLAPHYELRCCIDSQGSDSLAFLPLPSATWAGLEQRYGVALKRHFYRFAERPNLFTDPLPF